MGYRGGAWRINGKVIDLAAERAHAEAIEVIARFDPVRAARIMWVDPPLLPKPPKSVTSRTIWGTMSFLPPGPPPPPPRHSGGPVWGNNGWH